MSKKKKVLLGAGIAAVSVVAVAGGLFVGKKLYDKHKANKAHGSSHAPDSFSKREIGDDSGPDVLAPFHQPHPKTFTDTAPIPDAVALGINYDENSGAKINLLTACFDFNGANLGYIQAGGQLTSLFNNALHHSAEGDAVGDEENIFIDLQKVPQNCSQILFGAYLVNPPTSGLPKAYIHMLPMLRGEHYDQVTAAPEEEHNQAGTRGIGGEEEEEEEDDDLIVRLYKDELDHTQFGLQKGFVGGKIFRDTNTGAWFLTPYRTAVNADPQFGLWPALEHYAKPVQY